MILPLGGLLIGAALGAIAARARGGRVLDLLQWAAVWAMMGGVVGLFILIALSRGA